MGSAFSSSSADELVLNAELRAELEPFEDESVACIQSSHWTVSEENCYLNSILQWEKAPVLPIYRWFEPELHPVKLQTIPDEKLPALLDTLVQKLYEKRIVLDFTDHLSDRELYRLIVQKILPQNEKMIELRNSYRHWDCSRVDETGNEADDAKIWLKYYATDLQRNLWAETYGILLPEKDIPPYHRDFPKDDSLRY